MVVFMEAPVGKSTAICHMLRCDPYGPREWSDYLLVLSLQMKKQLLLHIGVACILVGCSTRSSISLSRDQEFRQRYVAWRQQCEEETRRMNGLLAAYIDTAQFKAMVSMGQSVLPELIQLGKAYDTSSSRSYREKNSCDRFMAYAAARITGIDLVQYPERRKFWEACEKKL
jgi:hypothetical protein